MERLHAKPNTHYKQLPELDIKTINEDIIINSTIAYTISNYSGYSLSPQPPYGGLGDHCKKSPRIGGFRGQKDHSRYQRVSPPG
ncbi:hypothetical protein Dacsa_0041 [Dactylococcopsis salina PCC 8305]|uniref:Uncharacterized protein n=1 Tax=Dactylococcopsis salina (strain PCC 8305) TaxID=13035 RepID=K9YRZ1_DACS8|nr:hypothetical protein Dacsa_0041 [Dactylococcopsis salina PCC 8305]